MFSPKTLLSLLFIALSTVDASPLTRRTGKATLGFVTRVNERGSMHTIADRDRARIQAMKHVDQLKKRSISFDVMNAATHYVAEVEVGEPATTYSLLIDTGSSNTFVGVNKTYKPTLFSKDTGNAVAVNYGSGNFSGEEWIDIVKLAPDLVIFRQSIGVASSSNGFQGVNGILGVGPTDLTHGTVRNTGTVPTVTDNLYAQGTIEEEVLGVYFVPFSESSSTGRLTFGGYDEHVITSQVDYVPITTTQPASSFWGIDQSITYGDETILESTAGIVDTGTTLVLVATNAFQKYQAATGGILDSATGLLSITASQYDNLKPLTFHVAGGKSYELSPNGQMWPRSLNTAIGGSSSAIYLVVSNMGTPSGSGLDFANGFTFLERFYSVYDTTNRRVGFATTDYTDSKTN